MVYILVYLRVWEVYTLGYTSGCGMYTTRVFRVWDVHNGVYLRVRDVHHPGIP